MRYQEITRGTMRCQEVTMGRQEAYYVGRFNSELVILRALRAVQSGSVVSFDRFCGLPTSFCGLRTGFVCDV